MAERKGQHQVRCQNQYVYDRLSPQKMSQVYHWLVPTEAESPCDQNVLLTVAKNEKERSHLRPGFL
jgi:hypothetical protein